MSTNDTAAASAVRTAEATHPPHVARRMHRAREIAPEVRVLDGPHGNRGFRSGRWRVRHDGRERHIRASLPASMSRENRAARIAMAAAFEIAAEEEEQ